MSSLQWRRRDGHEKPPTSKCNALKANGHPCRNYGTLTAKGGYLCHSHRDFYSDPEKLYTIIYNSATIFQTDAGRKWIMRALHSPDCKINKLFMAYKIHNLLCADSTYKKQKGDHIYRVIVEAGLMDPFAMYRAWKRGVGTSLRTLQFCTAAGMPRQRYRIYLDTLLKPYIANTVSPIAVLFNMLLFMKKPSFVHEGIDIPAPPIPIDISGLMWTEVIEYTCEHLPLRVLAVYDIMDFMEKLDRANAATPESAWHRHGMRDFVYLLFREIQQRERAMLCCKTDVFKQELVERVFNPARVAAALEAGLNPEDM